MGDFAGSVRFRRRFGYPGQIDEVERVWLAFEGIEGESTISLNGKDLGSTRATRLEHEITGLLQSRNELVVEITSDQQGGLWGEVALEVRRTAYLGNVEARVVEGCALVKGQVIGPSEELLELYLLGERRTLAYQAVENHTDRSDFELRSEPLTENELEARMIRLELVCGSTIWYGLEVLAK